MDTTPEAKEALAKLDPCPVCRDTDERDLDWSYDSQRYPPDGNYWYASCHNCERYTVEAKTLFEVVRKWNQGLGRAPA